MNKQKNSGAASIAAGLALIVAALLLTVYNGWDAARAGQAAQAALLALTEQMPETILPALPTEPDAALPTVEIDGNRYIGTIEIPALSLTLPVMEACTEENLKTAPCLYSGSYRTDNMVLAGHNYQKHFGAIKWLAAGSAVCFTAADGARYSYTVEQVETLPGDAVEEMIDSDWALTLFTCDMSGQNRCAVRCG